MAIKGYMHANKIINRINNEDEETNQRLKRRSTGSPAYLALYGHKTGRLLFCETLDIPGIELKQLKIIVKKFSVD